MSAFHRIRSYLGGCLLITSSTYSSNVFLWKQCVPMKKNKLTSITSNWMKLKTNWTYCLWCLIEITFKIQYIKEKENMTICWNWKCLLYEERIKKSNYKMESNIYGKFTGKNIHQENSFSETSLQLAGKFN